MYFLIHIFQLLFFKCCLVFLAKQIVRLNACVLKFNLAVVSLIFKYDVIALNLIAVIIFVLLCANQFILLNYEYKYSNENSNQSIWTIRRLKKTYIFLPWELLNIDALCYLRCLRDIVSSDEYSYFTFCNFKLY